MPRSNHRTGCTPRDHARIGRRRLLEAGGLSLLGLGLSDLLKAEASPARSGKGRAKSVVFIFQSGGPSQYETWDPKPDAPSEVRGEYGTTATRTIGYHVCEYLPRLAARTDKFSIVRTMHHPAAPQFRNEHAAATYMLRTGRSELPPGENTNTIALAQPRRFEWPSIGSAISNALPSSGSFGLPPAIEIPRGNERHAGSGPGMLGSKHAPWYVDLAVPCYAPDGAGSCPNCFSHAQPNDPARAPGKHPGAWWDNSGCRDASFHLPDLGASTSLSVENLQSRAALLEELDAARRSLDMNSAVHSLDVFRQQAWDLILGQRGKDNPFDLSQESDATRDLYGREVWGQSFLTARRLVEVGVRMVQVNLRGWDTHQNAFRDLKGKLLPSLDNCLSGFLDDLEAHGLLDETLVVMCGEMGRTPRISVISPRGKNIAGEPFTPGRDHWGDVFPCFFAGGGIQPGRVIGETDRTGGLPTTEAYSAGDLAATIFHSLGIDPGFEFHDAEGRPFRLLQGAPIAALL